ncbi:hypothetical protein Ahy_B10g105829 [Arachis hypogaea]|uniref:Uncharacterized protein n=1 Tax=Arachis hypogaea TaxID=3818 RepID=A0A444X8Y4_ARAHY|nr:hypothetical protein Ahy_B10g105829 [Arachis hypogaea]
MEPGDMLKMKRVVEADEIEQAIFAMGSLKAPGEDGLPAGFYKANWELGFIHPMAKSYGGYHHFWALISSGGANGAFDKTIFVALWTPNKEEVMILMSVNSAEFAASTAQRANREPEIVATKTRAVPKAAELMQGKNLVSAANAGSLDEELGRDGDFAAK